jgi:hypothetical protein
VVVAVVVVLLVLEAVLLPEVVVVVVEVAAQALVGLGELVLALLDLDFREELQVLDQLLAAAEVVLVVPFQAPLLQQRVVLDLPIQFLVVL